MYISKRFLNTQNKQKVATLALVAAALLFSNPAWAEKPYISEMPDTIGNGKHQFEYGAEYNRPRHTPNGLSELSLTSQDFSYTYGVSDNFDLAINIPFDSLRADYENPFFVDESTTDLQDIAIIAKSNYYKNGATDLSTKLELSLPTGDEKIVNSARSQGKVNVALVSSHRLNITNKFSLHNNITFATRNRKGSLNNSEFVATLGGTYNFTPELSGIVDGGYSFMTRDSDQNGRFVVLGVSYAKNGTKIGGGFKVIRSGNEVQHGYSLGVQQVF
jgi:hypothetical protein